MQLKESGTIQVDGYNARRTDDNQWLVTKAGVVVDYLDSIVDIYNAIDEHETRIRARADKAEADAKDRAKIWGGGSDIMSF